MATENKFRKISRDNLKLDILNPRLPKSKQGKDEAEVIKFMLLESATLELMMAIGENNFFEGEQLLVVPDKDDVGKFIVVEGNRRLTAVKLLSNPELSVVKKDAIKRICEEAEHKPKEIPCLIFSEKEEILKYLGFRHITGIKSWRLLEKGRYLYDLKQTEYNDVPFLQACREIAKSIGSSSSYIRRLLTGVELYNKIEDVDFYSIDGLNDTRFHLNYYTDALNKEHIRTFLGVDFNSELPLENLNEDKLKEITHWWFKETEGKSRVLGDSKSLKMLDAVINSSVALEAFRGGASIDHSYELTDDLELLFKNEVEKSLRSLEQADIYSNKIDKFYTGLYDDLKSINDLAKKIKNYQQQRERDNDDF
ncbi:MAG: hypothetical protein N4A49_11260 [Marinifilaceae bacterium]|nr:hypothetical protein [Marinifilaceae bacterium]